MSTINTSQSAPSANGITADAASIASYGLFLRHGQLFGIGTRFLLEVIRGQTLTRVAQTSPDLAGLLNLRGEVLPVLLVDAWLGLEKEVYNSAKPILVLRHQDLFAGVQVDSIQAVANIPMHEIQSAPAGSGSDLLSGLWRDANGRLASLIEGGALLDRMQQHLSPKKN